MKIKDLIAQLQQLPPDQHISVNGDDFYIEALYKEYDEDVGKEIWVGEMDFDYVMKHRDKFPEKIRWRFVRKWD